MSSISRITHYFAMALVVCTTLVSLQALALQTPEPETDSDLIYWQSVAAITINVHRGNGSWVASLPGDETSWRATDEGDYFLVAADRGDWRTWLRSETITVRFDSNDPERNDNLLLSEFRGIAYSSTALEIFWQPVPNTPYIGAELYINSQKFIDTNGRSFFHSGLTPNTDYLYTLIPYDDKGRVGPANDLVVTTRQDFSQPDNPDPTPELLPPENIRAEIYSSSAIELFWSHAPDFKNQPTSYRVYQDSIEIGSTSGTSFYVNSLESGTRYEFKIKAVSSNLNDSDSVSITALTTGYPVTQPTGKPAGTRNTHRFGLWDNMEPEQAAIWPSDCLFGIRGANLFTVPSYQSPNLCFSPTNRFLIHRNLFAFSLPGDNDTNHVEAVEWLHPRQIGLITDITTEFAQSQYEFSLFFQQGDFEGTFPILEWVTQSSRNSNERAINLDGKDVKVTVRVNDRRGGYTVLDLIVIGEYYDPIVGQDTSNLEGWDRVGAFVSWINPANGSENQTTYFIGRTMESITEDEIDR